MIIKRIQVKRFRAIKELKNPIDFSPGFNIIKGSDNEAGKSSLRMAITKALFQDPTIPQKDVQSLTSWGASEPWEVTLEFDADGGSYCITKSFKDKTCELASSGPNEFVARNKNTIAEKIAELTGCPSETFFESTVCIGQEEFVRIVPESVKSTTDNPVGTITKRLQAKLSGSEGADIPALLARLYDKTHYKDAAGPYFHLQRISEQIADMRNQRLEQELKVNGILEKRRILAQARLEMEQINRDLPAKQDLLDKNKKVLGLQREITGNRAQYDIFQKAKALKAEINRLEEELEPFSHFSNAEEKLKEIESAKSREDYLARQSTVFKDDLQKLEQQKPALWILVAGIILIGGGFTGLIANPLLWMISMGGLLLTTYWLISHRIWKKQRKAAIQKQSELEKVLKKNGEEEQQLLREFDCAGYEEFQGRLADYRTKIVAKRDALKGMEALTDGKDWQKFIEENLDLDIQVGSRIKELQQLEPFKLEPLPLQQLEHEVDSLLKRQDNLGREIGALEKFFQYTDVDRDQLTDREEELTELEQEREFWERKRKVYELTHEILEQAYKQTLSRAAELMEAEMSRCIALVTDGRYSQVKIKETENDLSIETFSPEMNDWVDVDELSRATQDQFYICARLALAKLITEGKRPVILLDDPFVNFHAKRLKKMMALLQDIAKGGYQILLFTCSDVYDYLGKVISID